MLPGHHLINQVSLVFWLCDRWLLFAGEPRGLSAPTITDESIGFVYRQNIPQIPRSPEIMEGQCPYGIILELRTLRTFEVEGGHLQFSVVESLFRSQCVS